MTTTTKPTDGNNGGKTQTQTHKKQVRRRLHTSRPYQERLLNMAEARREIVTALKQHRASMRQTAKIPPSPPPPQNLFSPPPPPPPPDPFSWMNPQLNILLPNQPLGLNLNFHDFNDFITTSSSSSSSSNSSSSSSSIKNPHTYSSPSPPPSTFAATSNPSSQQPPKQLMVPENNVETSAWWSELMMKSVETEMIKSEEKVSVVEDDVFPKFNDVMEFPSWLNPTDEELFHPYNLTNHYSSPQNPPLSCMEIGDIEGMDGDDWLAWLSHKD
ncbi:unnamed protein product [Eruca vesicaria subsp. sativa]|uniref:Uncharacterized protein n=1 Tax=Eruca vesicaria subsp. sativa TaxID=29727 RepID=A0ABC8LIJ7_ERUVS|nr:unnamed protein product [Eruca vesicaria subsp. sativa]